MRITSILSAYGTDLCTLELSFTIPFQRLYDFLKNSNWLELIISTNFSVVNSVILIFKIISRF
ncbi:hypothetical protein AMI01nite_36480 [Aneurinibacillus migulanus]|nr:hypothetical protein AMI01nite_36480 [Aneurinibacillus migulanus]